MIWFLGFPLIFFFSVKPVIFFSSMFFLDYISCFLVSIAFFISNLIFFFSFYYSFFKEYLFYLFSFIFILFFMCLSFISSNVFFFLFLFEFSLFPMIFLIFNFSKDSDKIISGFFMFLMNVFGSVPFMIFISFFYEFSFTFYLNYLAIEYFFFSFDFFLVFFFMLLIFFFKLPIFFFHFWLPKAHVSASVSCSMVLASLMLKLGSFGIVKFSAFFSFFFFYYYMIFSSLSLFFCFILTFFIFRYFDHKYFIAVSSILHMSFMPIFIFSLCSLGLVSCMFMMVSHGLISFFLFFLLSLSYEQTFNRSIDFNKSLESISKSFCWFYIIYVFMNMGVPPFLNFFSEFFYFSYFLSFSLIFLVFFFISMLVVNIYTMYFCSKFILGKKVFFVFSDLNLSFVFFSFFNLLIIFFLPFLF